MSAQPELPVTRNQRLVHLKVKIKSLADEARTIRQEEAKAKLSLPRERIGPAVCGLRSHRIHVVRPAARYAQLAYGFLRGRRYRSMETVGTVEPNLDRLVSEVLRFAPRHPDPGAESSVHSMSSKSFTSKALRHWMKTD